MIIKCAKHIDARSPSVGIDVEDASATDLFHIYQFCITDIGLHKLFNEFKLVHIFQIMSEIYIFTKVMSNEEAILDTLYH